MTFSYCSLVAMEALNLLTEGSAGEAVMGLISLAAQIAFEVRKLLFELYIYTGQLGASSKATEAYQ